MLKNNEEISSGDLKKSYRQQLLELLPKHNVGAEIGVYQGGFAEEILVQNKPSKLFLIDPWIYEDGDVYRDAWYGGNARGGQLEMDDIYRKVCFKFRGDIDDGVVEIVRKKSNEALNAIGEEQLDWVYIDGNHLYEFVRNDLLNSYRAVKKGGCISGDDYEEGGWWDGGVKRAVDEFVSEFGIKNFSIIGNQFYFVKSG